MLVLLEWYFVQRKLVIRMFMFNCFYLCLLCLLEIGRETKKEDFLVFLASINGKNCGVQFLPILWDFLDINIKALGPSSIFNLQLCFQLKYCVLIFLLQIQWNAVRKIINIPPVYILGTIASIFVPARSIACLLRKWRHIEHNASIYFWLYS